VKGVPRDDAAVVDDTAATAPGKGTEVRDVRVQRVESDGRERNGTVEVARATGVARTSRR